MYISLPTNANIAYTPFLDLLYLMSEENYFDSAIEKETYTSMQLLNQLQKLMNK